MILQIVQTVKTNLAEDKNVQCSYQFFLKGVFAKTKNNRVWSLLILLLSLALIDATDRSSSHQKRFFFAVSLYPFLFFANTPFKYKIVRSSTYIL